MSVWEPVLEDSESPGWWLCSNRRWWGINHPCEVRGKDDYLYSYIWTFPDYGPDRCEYCHTQMSDSMDGMFRLLAGDQQ